jgi:hypothetical protein
MLMSSASVHCTAFLSVDLCLSVKLELYTHVPQLMYLSKQLLAYNFMKMFVDVYSTL